MKRPGKHALSPLANLIIFNVLKCNAETSLHFRLIRCKFATKHRANERNGVETCGKHWTTEEYDDDDEQNEKINRKKKQTEPKDSG